MDFAVIIPSQYAQASRKVLEISGIWDETRRLQSISCGKVAIPVKYNEFDLHILSDIVCVDEIVISEINLPQSKKSVITTPADSLRENLQSHLCKAKIPWTLKIEKDLPSNWEKHGDLVLLPESCFKLPLWHHMDQELWRVVAAGLDCKRVAKKSIICNNGFRTPQVKLLLGENGWVNQTDNKMRFTYNVEKCMFSIGNISEKLRIANFDCHGETVVDLYAGIGYFTLPYLVHGHAERVHACEWNPDAVEALKKNLKLNNVQDKCSVYFGDNMAVCPVGVADRVNLGLIPSSENGWPVACAALKATTGGVLHIHGNVTTLYSENKKSQDGCNQKGNIEINTTTIEKKQENFDAESSDVINPGVLYNSLFSSSEINEECVYKGFKNTHASCDDSDDQRLLHSSKTTGISSKSSWSEWAEFVSAKIRQLLFDCHQKKWKTVVRHIEHVKSYAPHVDHLVLDLECRPLPE